MKILNELEYDFSLLGPKVSASAKAAVVYNVKEVIMISEDSVTASTGAFYVNVSGAYMRVGEIWEGRMEIEGEISKIEFFRL